MDSGPVSAYGGCFRQNEVVWRYGVGCTAGGFRFFAALRMTLEIMLEGVTLAIRAIEIKIPAFAGMTGAGGGDDVRGVGVYGRGAGFRRGLGCRLGLASGCIGLARL